MKRINHHPFGDPTSLFLVGATGHFNKHTFVNIHSFCEHVQSIFHPFKFRFNCASVRFKNNIFFLLALIDMRHRRDTEGHSLCRRECPSVEKQC